MGERFEHVRLSSGARGREDTYISTRETLDLI